MDLSFKLPNRRMSSLIPDPQPQPRERRASSFLNRIFRKSTGNAMEAVEEEPTKEQPQQPQQQQQPNFVMQLQEKIAQIR
jgi:hypothetical protein